MQIAGVGTRSCRFSLLVDVQNITFHWNTHYLQVTDVGNRFLFSR